MKNWNLKSIPDEDRKKAILEAVNICMETLRPIVAAGPNWTTKLLLDLLCNCNDVYAEINQKLYTTYEETLKLFENKTA